MTVEQYDFLIEIIVVGLMVISFYSGIKLGYQK